MKQSLLVPLLAIVMLFPLQSAFAQAKNSSAKIDIVPSISENEHHIDAFRVDKIIGSGVINLDGEPIGIIDDLVIDIDDGSLVYAAIKTGGFLGFGGKLLAVPWQSLTAVPAEGLFVIDQSKAKLEKASSFDENNWPDVGDQTWRAGIYEFYRHHLPSPRNSESATGIRKQKRHLGYQPYPGYTDEPYAYPSVWQNIYGSMFDPKKIETVTGKIIKVQFNKVMQLLIYTDMKKPVLVALGPTGYFESQERKLKPGDKITVTGSKVVADDTPFLIATKIKEENAVLQVRDNEGHPIWIGWRQIK